MDGISKVGRMRELWGMKSEDSPAKDEDSAWATHKMSINITGAFWSLLSSCKTAWKVETGHILPENKTCLWSDYQPHSSHTKLWAHWKAPECLHHNIDVWTQGPKEHAHRWCVPGSQLENVRNCWKKVKKPIKDTKNIRKNGNGTYNWNSLTDYISDPASFMVILWG